MSEPTPPAPPKTRLPKPRSLVVGSAAVGAAYGLAARMIAGAHIGDTYVFAVMSGSFIFGVPIAIGFLTVWSGEKRGGLSWPQRVFLPWLASLAFLAGCLVFLLEGLICAVLLAPVLLFLSTLGGLIAVGVLRLLDDDSSKNYCAAVIALLPLAAYPIEALRTEASQVRTVRTQVDIRADPRAVWEQVRSVPVIRADEQSFDLSHLIGFPRPVEATLRGEGIGSVRYATFEHGVLFIETVTDWEPDHRLAFSIHADAKHIPPTTFDEHVQVGGRYFDVLSGCYQIEDLGHGMVRLHLSSEQRLSTRFNFYSHLWTEWLMADLQNYILAIIKRRCEASAPARDRAAALPPSDGRA